MYNHNTEFKREFYSTKGSRYSWTVFFRQENIIRNLQMLEIISISMFAVFIAIFIYEENNM